MDEAIAARRGESETHARLKRLAVVWAQANGYSACAVEVSLPQCRYRADVAAYRAMPLGSGCTAVFECKQARSDLRKDSCCTASGRARLITLQARRAVLEKHLRFQHPTSRAGESLFPEWDSYDFGDVQHRGYTRVLREIAALQKQLRAGTKFEKLVQYHCANLLFLVVPNELFRAAELPIGWGALVERDGALHLARKPLWRENSADAQHRFLHRIAAAGTRHLNRQMQITFAEIVLARAAQLSGR